MPRVHWAVKCRARRTNGRPCGRWSIRGGFVCAAHGGSLARTRQAAIVRLAEIVFRREFDVAWTKYQRRRTEWAVDRVLTTSRLLGVPIEDLEPIDFVLCHMEYGVPPLLTEQPEITDIPNDRRYEPFFRLGSADPRGRKAGVRDDR